jgi:hypothetical protein
MAVCRIGFSKASQGCPGAKKTAPGRKLPPEARCAWRTLDLARAPCVAWSCRVASQQSPTPLYQAISF